MPTRTCVDARLLIGAFRGEPAVAQRATAVLDDPNRELVLSDSVRLEVLPKPIFHKQDRGKEFMRKVFAQAKDVPCSAEITQKALELASRYDLRPLDALHVGSAVLGGVEELVTLEKPGNTMCKVREVRVTSLHSSSP